MASVIVAGLFMVLTRCVRSVDAAYKMIGWESIVLIAAMMPMSAALSKTGISDWIAHTLASSLCFATPICTPPNAMVMNAGHYNFMDYVKVGLPLQLIMGIVAIAAITLFCPL